MAEKVPDTTYIERKTSLSQGFSWQNTTSCFMIRLQNSSLMSVDETKSYLASFDIDVQGFDKKAGESSMVYLTVKSSTLRMN